MQISKFKIKIYKFTSVNTKNFIVNAIKYAFANMNVKN